MSNRILEHLLKKEWSMGNGQCPECGGVPEDWFGHPLYLTPEKIGHEKDCILAESINEKGVEPLYIGQFKNDIEYWNVITEEGFFSTEIKTKEISQSRQRAVDHNEYIFSRVKFLIKDIKGGNK